jgi:predicted DNA binding CopG/RHH family protein
MMNHKEKIKELEEKERSLMLQSIEGATVRAVSPSLHRELAEVRAELKAARRVATMKARRTEPTKTSRFSILLPDDELEALTKKAEEKGVVFSSYIRHLLKIGLAVEAKGTHKGKVEK